MDRFLEFILDPAFLAGFVVAIVASVIANLVSESLRRRLTESNERYRAWRSAKSDERERMIDNLVEHAEADPMLERFYQHLEARQHRSGRQAFDIMVVLAAVTGVLVPLAWATGGVGPLPFMAAAFALAASLATAASISYGNHHRLYVTVNDRVGFARERRRKSTPPPT